MKANQMLCNKMRIIAMPNNQGVILYKCPHYARVSPKDDKVRE